MTFRNGCLSNSYHLFPLLFCEMPPRTCKAPVSGLPAIEFNSLAVKIAEDNHLAKRLYEDLKEVLPVARHTAKIFGDETVGKALRGLKPIVGMPVLPSPLLPTSLTHEEWFNVLHLFTKACVNVPGIKQGTFRKCASHDGTRSTVLRWAEAVRLWQGPPVAQPIGGVPMVVDEGLTAGGTPLVGNDAKFAAIQEQLSSFSAILAKLSERLEAPAKVVAQAAGSTPDVVVVTAEKVGDKRGREEEEWEEELEALMGGEVHESPSKKPGISTDPGVGASANGISENVRVKPGEKTPPGRSLAGILKHFISPQQNQQHQRDQEQETLSERFAQAESVVGMCIDQRSLKAIDAGLLVKLQLGHFAPSSGNLAANNAAAERQGTQVWFSFADGKIETNGDDKFKFVDMLQFIAAMSNFVKVWGVLKPDSHLASLSALRDLFLDWAHSGIAPVATLVDVWIDHKRRVGARRFTVPPFDWLDGGRDVNLLQFKLQSAMNQQWFSAKVQADKSTTSIRPIKEEKSPRPGASVSDTPPSKRELKKAKLAEDRQRSKDDKMKTLCKFGDDCRVFKEKGSCGFLHK